MLSHGLTFYFCSSHYTSYLPVIFELKHDICTLKLCKKFEMLYLIENRPNIYACVHLSKCNAKLLLYIMVNIFTEAC